MQSEGVLDPETGELEHIASALKFLRDRCWSLGYEEVFHLIGVAEMAASERVFRTHQNETAADEAADVSNIIPFSG